MVLENWTISYPWCFYFLVPCLCSSRAVRVGGPPPPPAPYRSDYKTQVV
jgi:hypothetical protein